jgi:hypothetical protein
MTTKNDIDALFQLPLAEFTAARNALAAKLKKAERADEAVEVQVLTKPPVSAWAVNQLYWRHRNAFDRLIGAGDRLRTAQASQLRGKGGELKEPLEARRAALAELTKHAATLLRESGHNPSPDLMRRVTTTLEALATYGSRTSASAAGRLTEDVNAPGFEALADLLPDKGARTRDHDPGQRRVLPFVSQRERKVSREKLSPEERKRQAEGERKQQLASATAALRDAERSLADARKGAERAEASLKKAAARAKETQKEQDALTARLEKATAAADQARQEARSIAAEAEEAAQAVADAERALEEARRKIKSFTD